VLRTAMREIVPDSVRSRRGKAYFDAPFAKWAGAAVSREIARNTINFRNLEPYLHVEMLEHPTGDPRG
jgi:hypothetical protein